MNISHMSNIDSNYSIPWDICIVDHLSILETQSIGRTNRVSTPIIYDWLSNFKKKRREKRTMLIKKILTK